MTSSEHMKIDVNEDASYETQTDKRRYSEIGESLYRAALEGDWQSAHDLSKEYDEIKGKLHPEMKDLQATKWEFPISQQKMNVLQVAIAAKQTAFVIRLLKCMSTKELEFKNDNGDTALAITALSESVEIAEKIVEMKRALLVERNNQNILPLIRAAMHRQRDMVLYLFSETDFQELKDHEKMKLLLLVISCDLYDIAKVILELDPALSTAAEDKSGCTALEQLARKPLAIGSRINQMSLWEKCKGYYIAKAIMKKDPTTLATVEDETGGTALGQLPKKLFAIGSRSQMSAWERCISYCFKGVYHKVLMRTSAHQLVEDIWQAVRKLPLKQFIKYSSAFFLAAELGNIEFLTILIRSKPDLIWIVDEHCRNIFHISVLYRQDSIFNLIHEIGIFQNLIAASHDEKRNNMLHLAGKLAPANRLNIVSGAALHMQLELLWFKEVERIVPHAFLKDTNLEGKTPHDLFIETHKTLHKDGEEWMRGTAMHCMLVATLIATVVFAAAFTIPGGNDQGKGTPIFLELDWFLVFFISNSIALISSSTSILIFLSILTSRYREKDFLGSLPRRLLFGLFALFISIVAMVVAFGATCFLVYQRKATRIPTVIIALAGIPISSFIVLHYELLVDIIRATYSAKFLFGSRKRLFHMKVEHASSNNWSVKRIVKAIKGILSL